MTEEKHINADTTHELAETIVQWLECINVASDNNATEEDRDTALSKCIATSILKLAKYQSECILKGIKVPTRYKVVYQHIGKTELN